MATAAAAQEPHGLGLRGLRRLHPHEFRFFAAWADGTSVDIGLAQLTAADGFGDELIDGYQASRHAAHLVGQRINAFAYDSTMLLGS